MVLRLKLHDKIHVRTRSDVTNIHIRAIYYYEYFYVIIKIIL